MAEQVENPSEGGTAPIRVEAPGASEAELAAIVAAIEALWPTEQAPVVVPAPPPPWRFSGRWWHDGARARRRPSPASR